MAGDVRQGKKDQLHNFQPVAVADYTFLSVENNAALFCRDSSCASLSRARCPLVLRKYSCCEIMVLFVSEKSAFHLQDLGLHPVGTSVFSFPTYFLKFTSTCLFSLVGERSKNKTHLHSSNLWGLGVGAEKSFIERNQRNPIVFGLGSTAVWYCKFLMEIQNQVIRASIANTNLNDHWSISTFHNKRRRSGAAERAGRCQTNKRLLLFK